MLEELEEMEKEMMKEMMKNEMMKEMKSRGEVLKVVNILILEHYEVILLVEEETMINMEAP